MNAINNAPATVEQTQNKINAGVFSKEKQTHTVITETAQGIIKKEVDVVFFPAMWGTVSGDYYMVLATIFGEGDGFTNEHDCMEWVTKNIDKPICTQYPLREGYHWYVAKYYKSGNDGYFITNKGRFTRIDP